MSERDFGNLLLFEIKILLKNLENAMIKRNTEYIEM